MNNSLILKLPLLCNSVADQLHFDADPDHSFHFDADPDPSFQIKAQNLEKVHKKALIPYILTFHLQLDADPDPVYHFDPDPDATYFQFDAYPDP